MIFHHSWTKLFICVDTTTLELPTSLLLLPHDSLVNTWAALMAGHTPDPVSYLFPLTLVENIVCTFVCDFCKVFRYLRAIPTDSGNLFLFCRVDY